MVDDELQGFADAATLKSRYGASSHAFLLRLAHAVHEANFPVGIEDDRHLFIMAESRAGKGALDLQPRPAQYGYQRHHSRYETVKTQTGHESLQKQRFKNRRTTS